MPTIGYRPTLETTQAVGALLLHQFARERFSRAGVDESLIREAEYRENVDQLVAQSLLDQSHCAEDQINLNNSNHNVTTPGELNQGDESSCNNSAQMTTTLSTAATKNSTLLSHDTSATSSSFNATLASESQEQTYHSLQEQSLGGNDRTLYHSVANSTRNNESSIQHNNSAASLSTFDRLQSSPNVTLYGEELRRMAEEFERSSLREMVRNRANQVNLADISKESFTRLLKELFQEKITREKIVILFFFCTDVALRAADFAKELVVKLMGWSFSYIINIVCSLVHKLGGWDRVLFYQLPSLLITCCAGLAICAMLVFLRNNWRTERA